MKYLKIPLTCDPLLSGYSIDTNGILYSKFNRPMKPSLNHRGYLIQAFNVSGKMIARSMHQLVAKQFIPNPQNKKTVNHKNGNKQDNRVDNLEWATQTEQMQHASKVIHVLKQANKIPIIGLSINSDEIVYFSSMKNAASYFGVRCQSISSVIHGRRLSCRGFLLQKSLSNNAETILELHRIKKEKKIRRKFREMRVGKFSIDNQLIHIYPNAYATRFDGFCHQIVYRCCAGQAHYKTYKGYVWKYIE